MPPGTHRRFARAVRRVERSASEDGPLAALSFALVLLGVGLRARDLGFPEGLTWDEHHFVLNARNYIEHKHDWNDHPPLGKLLMVPWMRLLGDTSASTRLSAFVFGLVSIVVARALAIALFRDRRAGWLAAAFVAGDGFFIAYSRTALLDGVLTALCLTVAWLAVTARSPLRIALAAVVIGCAANVKESGFALGLPVALLCLGRPRALLRIATLALAPVVYTAWFCLGLHAAGDPSSPVDAWTVTFKMIRDHSNANEFKHPLTSHWYTWFLPRRPITLRYDVPSPNVVRASSTLANLVLYWTSDVALLAGGGVAARTLHAMFRKRSLGARVGRFERGVSVLFLFAFTMLLPWIIGRQDSYIYHYLPTYGFLLVGVAGAIARLYRSARVEALAFVSVVCLVTAFYAPVWGQLPLSHAAYEARLFLPGWR